MELTNREWKEFYITDIAEILSGQDIYESERIQGETPYISATANVNGIGYFVGNSNKTLEKNCLSVNRNGSVGYAFFHPYEALFSNDCRKLRLKHPNKYVGIFISHIITRQKEKYGYGYKMGTARLQRQKILLPVNDNGTPDYAFMESYMKQKESELLNEYENYVSLLKPSEKVNTEIEWKEFLIGDIFKISSTSSSIDKVKLTGKQGLFPYITRTDKNNGYDSFVGKQPKYSTDKGNVITIGLDTQTVFYQETEFYTGQNIQILEFDEINKHNAQFIIALLKIQMKKFSWGGNGATLTRLKKTRILLPKTADGKPDYGYMENYVKALEYRKLKQYLDYKKLNKTD